MEKKLKKKKTNSGKAGAAFENNGSSGAMQYVVDKNCMCLSGLK